MKKILLSLFGLILPILMSGCTSAVKLEDSMSEITKLYFIAEANGVNANISVGEREEDYIIDGNHTKNVDFSLIAIKFDNLLPENKIEVDVLINNVESKETLELNPANHYYMTDLGYALNVDDVVQIKYENFNLNFENVSNSFGVNYTQALEIATRELGAKMDGYYNGKDFNGEGYLKVLTGQNEEDDGLFWVLTIVGKNNLKNNVVLSVVNGEIIISD